MTTSLGYCCPICNTSESEDIFKLDCGNFDHSALYQTLKIKACQRCGHIFNGLSQEEVTGLFKYYNEEYAPTNLSSTDKIGDRPGTGNQNTLKRHEQLYTLIAGNAGQDARVLDIGCAMGGFLNYLEQKGFHHLAGIDVTQDYVNHTKAAYNHYDVRMGSAESIPFAGQSFDLLIMDQVLEHLFRPQKAFQEANRVLVDGGLFCIGIPDAARYNRIYFFDFFWFLMREHIQHFDICHAELLAEKEGFECIGFQESEIPMVSEKMILPNLNILFRKVSRLGKSIPPQDMLALRAVMNKYAETEFDRLNKKKKAVNIIIDSRLPVYAWGIGREFLYLYEAAGLKHSRLSGLIDANPHKRKNILLDGKNIADSTVLNNAPPDSILMITAIAHAKPIEDALKKQGFPGEIIKF